MAEGILRAAAADLLDVASAGTNPAGYVHPMAVTVMEELGIDISDHRSKHLDEFTGRDVGVVITVCGSANQACPRFPGQWSRYHWPFDDPAEATGAEDAVRAAFRETRDRIRAVFGAYAEGLRDAARFIENVS